MRRLVTAAICLVTAGTLLAGCAKEAPPIAVDSFCEKHTPKDFTDKGLRAQSDYNLRADLSNENTRVRDCIGDRTKSLSPR